MGLFDFLKRKKQPEPAMNTAGTTPKTIGITPEIIGNVFDGPALGALPNSPDNRDIPASAVIDEAATRPKKYKTDVQYLGVEDQRAHGSCVGQAEGKMIEFFEYDELEKVVRVSKRFIYSECKKRDGIPDVQGTYPRIAAKVLMDLGVPKESFVPDNNRLAYDEYVRPEVSKEAYEEGSQRKVKGYAFVNAFNQEEFLQSIYKAKVIPGSIIVGDTSKLPIKPTPSRGSHRILIIGYEEVDTKADRGRVKIFFLNSWGDNWGNDGEGWLWLDEYLGLIFDVMLYTDLPNKLIEDAKAAPFIFTRTLKYDMTGEDVKQLQIRLNQDPDTKVAETGYGSPGNETTYFGNMTREAVKAYQRKHGIVSSGNEETTGYGQVGPATRRVLNNEKQKDLYPKVARLRDDLKEIAKMAGFPIVITDEYRTFAEQDALYAKGRTTQGPIITNAKGGESFHNFQVAFDVAFDDGKGGLSYEGPWEKIGRIGEILGMEWGGRWDTFVDRPHFQYTGGYTLADFQKGAIDESRFI